MTESPVLDRPSFFDDGGAALHEWFHSIRDARPVVWDEPSRTWHVLRYAEATEVLADPARFSNAGLGAVMPAKDVVKGNLGMMDPPQHRVHRALVSQAFTQRALEQLTARITWMVDDLLDQSVGDQIEAIGDLADPLALNVIADLIGFPVDDRPVFKRCADAQVTLDTDDPTEPEFIRAREASLAELLEYLRGLADRRRAHPAEDLATVLANAEIDGTPLGDDVVVDFLLTVLMGGIITTKGMLGNALVCLDEHPALMPALLANPAAVPGVVEEVLRVRPSAQGTLRVAVADTTLGGQTIRAGEILMVAILAVNRDPRTFLEPDRFDPRRTPNPHVTFSHGIHFCLGAQLARLEMRTMIARIVRRCSRLRVSELEWLQSQGLTSPRRLMVGFEGLRPGT